MNALTPARFTRLERLAHEVLDLIRACNDNPNPAVDDIDIVIAAHNLERDLEQARLALTSETAAHGADS